MSDLDSIEAFLPDIRMKLHLDRIDPETAQVSETMIEDRQALGRLMSAYRRTPFRVESGLGNPLSRPMSVAEVADSIGGFSQRNRLAFADYMERIKLSGEPPRWTLPAYDLGPAGLLLLDGNHRAVATYIAARRFTIELRVLHGPLDRRILPPLKHWDGGLRRFWRRGYALTPDAAR